MIARMPVILNWLLYFAVIVVISNHYIDWHSETHLKRAIVSKFIWKRLICNWKLAIDLEFIVRAVAIIYQMSWILQTNCLDLQNKISRQRNASFCRMVAFWVFSETWNKTLILKKTFKNAYHKSSEKYCVHYIIISYNYKCDHTFFFIIYLFCYSSSAGIAALTVIVGPCESVLSSAL